MTEDKKDEPDLTTPEGLKHLFETSEERLARENREHNAEALAKLSKEWEDTKVPPENGELYEKYKAKLKGGYMYRGDPEKFKLIDRDFGWKIHLNTSAEDVEQVSEFLKKHGYTHKYLSTGNDETKSGKIFTVYFGPKKLAEECIRDVSDGIGNLLIPPLDKNEQLVAPNIIARFDTNPNSPRFKPIGFTPHSYYKGIPLLKYYNERDVEASIAQSSRLLTKEFGDFFGGSLATYKL